jgi:hypothetical protein
VFHGFQSPDHGFDTRAHLIVAIQQRGLFLGQEVLSLAQGAILFLELVDCGDEFVDALSRRLSSSSALAVRLVSVMENYNIAHILVSRPDASGQLPQLPRNPALDGAMRIALTARRAMALWPGPRVRAELSAGGLDLEILPEGPVLADASEALRGLYETRDALAGADMAFDLLLPDDDQSIDERTVRYVCGATASSADSAPAAPATRNACPATPAKSSVT